MIYGQHLGSLGRMTETFNVTLIFTTEVEAGGSLWIQGQAWSTVQLQPGLCRDLISNKNKQSLRLGLQIAHWLRAHIAFTAEDPSSILTHHCSSLRKVQTESQRGQT